MKPHMDKEGVNWDPVVLREFQARQRTRAGTTEKPLLAIFEESEGRKA